MGRVQFIAPRGENALAKQLHLDVAQLTDVGRKREHNEDNMAYVIPKDLQVMARKGALFIVADGMGGHAAGEVASEIAVDTISNVYYQDDSDDVAVSLLHAIKRSNALIYQRAAENMLRSGMGTTCVTAVLRGNIAYVANVGDSRAYLVRGGQVKQVSQDHSWVAEQVRAGLLTEDQARTHTQRNVITRCLGTQADVEVDVFSEQLQAGDSLVLCTDGLSGLVGDEEIQRIVEQFMPQESVYHLVERANENGGPDNITAIVVRVQEVGLEEPNGRRLVPVGGRETSDDTATLGLLPSTQAGLPGRAGEAVAISSPLRVSSGPLPSPDSITAPLSVIQPSRHWRSRLLYPTLALLILLLVTLVSGGAYYFFRTSNNGNIDQNLRTAQGLITQANGEVASSPAMALHDLAQGQHILQGLQKGSLSDTQRRTVTNLLQGNLTLTVKAAISRYNYLASITSLCATTPAQPINDGSTGTHAQSIASVQDSRGMLYRYALGQDNGLYEITPQNSLISRFPPTDHSQVLSIASDRTQLVVLTSLTPQPAKGSPTTTYSLGLWLPGATREAAATPIGNSFIQNGQVPKWIAAWGGDVYVVLASPTAQNGAQILDYTVNGNKFGGSPKQATISISTAIVSVAAFPGHQLFLLFADGPVQSLQFVGGNQSSTPVFIQHSIAPPLAVSDKDFTWTKPVPTVAPATQGGNTQLQAPLAVALSAGIVENTMHLYILDAGNHRVIDLKAAVPTPGSTAAPTPTSTVGGAASPGNTVTFQLLQQYVSSSVLAQVKSGAVDPRSTQVYVLTQNTPSVLSLVSINTGSPQSCS